MDLYLLSENLDCVFLRDWRPIGYPTLQTIETVWNLLILESKCNIYLFIMIISDFK